MNKYIKKGLPVLKTKCLERARYKCEMSGDNHVILDAHHILPKSVYPQYYLEPMNIVIISRLNWHDMAENHPEEFWREFLKCENLMDRIEWVIEKRGINKNPSEVDYEDQYTKLLKWDSSILF